MQYYRVRISADGVMVGGGYSLVMGELLTRTEINKRNVDMRYVEPVEVSKREVYWCFGCRFGDTQDTLDARHRLYKLGNKDIDSFKSVNYFRNTGHKDGDHGRYTERLKEENGSMTYEYCYIAIHTNECEGGRTLLIQFRKPVFGRAAEVDGKPKF